VAGRTSPVEAPRHAVVGSNLVSVKTYKVLVNCCCYSTCTSLLARGGFKQKPTGSGSANLLFAKELATGVFA
jgi:hypothetical protein